jgi:hypothetical protein
LSATRGGRGQLCPDPHDVGTTTDHQNRYKPRQAQILSTSSHLRTATEEHKSTKIQAGRYRESKEQGEGSSRVPFLADEAVGGGPVRWDRGWRRRCGWWTRGRCRGRRILRGGGERRRRRRRRRSVGKADVGGGGRSDADGGRGTREKRMTGLTWELCLPVISFCWIPK